MGGQGSGGTRSGQRGRAYSNRTDLNTNRVLPITPGHGQPYGTATVQTQAQRAIPLARPLAPSPTALPTPPAAQASQTPFSAPSARPGEPVTSGLSVGAGPGPETLFQPQLDQANLQVRALYAMYPNNDLLSLIEELDAGRSY